MRTARKKDPKALRQSLRGEPELLTAEEVTTVAEKVINYGVKAAKAAVEVTGAAGIESRIEQILLTPIRSFDTFT